MNKQLLDYQLAGLIGFVAGMCVIPVLVNLGYRNALLLVAIPWVVAGCLIFARLVGQLLGHIHPAFVELSRFGIVGVLNTAIDFGTLNILSVLTGVTTGLLVGGYNLPGLAIAVINSYAWNKFWVFRDGAKKGFEDIPQFITITGVGLLLNSAIVIVMTTYLPILLPTGSVVWLNISKVFATIFTLAWNFLGYKFVVFVAKKSATPLSAG